MRQIFRVLSLILGSALVTSVLLSGLIIFSGLITQQDVNLSLVSDMAITLYSSPSCGCCHQYVAYLEDFNIIVNHTIIDDVQNFKDECNIPEDLRSCHTSIMTNYTVEGHVPIEAIIKLISETPDIDGIALPGMPNGAPGVSGTKVSDFEIIAFKEGVSEGIYVLI